MKTTKQQESSKQWPDILQRYVDEGKPQGNDLPRPVVRRFHGREVPLWLGKVHIDDIEGYVENLRLKFYLNRWKAKKGPTGRTPTTDDIYEIMVEADNEEKRESKKPFQIERIADNIVRNQVREPIILYCNGKQTAELWDGNRRYYGSKHITKVDKEEYIEARERIQWLPAYVFLSTGDPTEDKLIRHDILVECNFVDPEQIAWPSYVKAEQIYNEYQKRMSIDPTDQVLSRQVKDELAKEFGLGDKKWRRADRWIKMYDLTFQFKEYQEEEREREATEVDLLVQERFEYFDELSKASVFGVLRDDTDVRDRVFDWLWDGKFKAFEDVRKVPKIVTDPVAWQQANEPGEDAVRRAIETVIANNPARLKDKTAANGKIKQFAAWLDSFRREEYKTLDAEALDSLKLIVKDVAKITRALLSPDELVEDIEETVVEAEAEKATPTEESQQDN
jgi:hypothetical protein